MSGLGAIGLFSVLCLWFSRYYFVSFSLDIFGSFVFVGFPYGFDILNRAHGQARSIGISFVDKHFGNHFAQARPSIITIIVLTIECVCLKRQSAQHKRNGDQI